MVLVPGTDRRRGWLRVSPQRFALIARWALWALVAIVITGTSVRLTGSGLGCSDWPNCEPGEFVPAADFHGWVEFGNRLVTGAVSVAVIAAVCASLWRVPRRMGLVWWSLALVAGVLFQIVLGAVTVLTHLSPPIVMSHFLASQVLVAAAVVLHWRAGERDGGGSGSGSGSETTEASRLAPAGPSERAAAAPGAGASGAAFPRSIRIGAWTMAALVAAAQFTGTVVTGTGPHGGDEHVERLQFALPSVARIHGITVVVLIAVTLLLSVRVRRLVSAARGDALDTGAHEIQRRVRIVIAVMATQAAIGYIQYFNELPVLLVALHVAGATLLTITVTRLVLSTRAAAAPQRGAAGKSVGIAGRAFAE